MCGIIHVKKLASGKFARKTLIKRYRTQKNRGTDGFGFIAIKNGICEMVYRATTEKGIMDYLDKCEADEILFHHRFPTSTPNFIEATHPIKVSHPALEFDYFLVHNGIIMNDDTLRDDHIKDGFEYTTEMTRQVATRGGTYAEEVMWNDSEALAIDFAMSLELKRPMKSRGSIALVALQIEKTTYKVNALFWGRNWGNPLKIEDKDDMLALSSETGVSVEPNVLFRLDYATNVLSSEEKKIGEWTYQGDSYNRSTPIVGFDTGKKKSWWQEEKEKDDFDIKERKDANVIFLDEGEGEIEENDFILDKEEELEHLRVRLSNAQTMEDWDLYAEIEAEVEELDRVIKDAKIDIWLGKKK